MYFDCEILVVIIWWMLLWQIRSCHVRGRGQSWSVVRSGFLMPVLHSHTNCLLSNMSFLSTCTTSRPLCLRCGEEHPCPQCCFWQHRHDRMFLRPTCPHQNTATQTSSIQIPLLQPFLQTLLQPSTKEGQLLRSQRHNCWQVSSPSLLKFSSRSCSLFLNTTGGDSWLRPPLVCFCHCHQVLVHGGAAACL